MKRQLGTPIRPRRYTQDSLGSRGFTSGKCKWKAQFAKRRKLDYKTENKSYLQWWADIPEDDENPEVAEESSAGDEPEESCVRVFMTALEGSNVNVPQADKIEEFCSSATLEQLCAENGERSAMHSSVAWLDERGMKGGVLRARPYRSPLTARELYHELKKPVGVSTSREGRYRLLLTSHLSAIQALNRAIAVVRRMTRTKHRVESQPGPILIKVVKMTSTPKDV